MSLIDCRAADDEACPEAAFARLLSRLDDVTPDLLSPARTTVIDPRAWLAWLGRKMGLAVEADG